MRGMTTGRSEQAPSGQRAVNASTLIQTQDIGKFCHGIARLFVDSTFDVSVDRKSHQAFRVSVHYRQFNHVGVMHASYGAKIHAAFSDVKFYTQGIPVNGIGQQATAGRFHSVDRRAGGVLSPDTPIGLTFNPGFEHFALLIDPHALVSKLTAMTGRLISRPPRLDGRTDFRKPAAIRLRDAAMLMARSEERTTMSSFVSELEQLAITSFLFANDHEYRDALDAETSSVASWRVRRVEEYIEANWHRSITIEALSAVSGCSARSLFHQFKRDRGYSPMDFLRHVRLRRAREMLVRPTAETSVTDVAFACGFGNLGHFAKYYREEFGELPSSVLLQARRRM